MYLYTSIEYRQNNKNIKTKGTNYKILELLELHKIIVNKNHYSNYIKNYKIFILIREFLVLVLPRNRNSNGTIGTTLEQRHKPYKKYIVNQ